MSENTIKNETSVKDEGTTENETATKPAEISDETLEQVSGGRRPRRTGPIPLPRD